MEMTQNTKVDNISGMPVVVCVLPQTEAPRRRKDNDIEMPNLLHFKEEVKCDIASSSTTYSIVHIRCVHPNYLTRIPSGPP